MSEQHNPEVGHAGSYEDLSTPVDDEQVEPGARPWVEPDEESDDAEPRPS